MYSTTLNKSQLTSCLKDMGSPSYFWRLRVTYCNDCSHSQDIRYRRFRTSKTRGFCEICSLKSKNGIPPQWFLNLNKKKKKWRANIIPNPQKTTTVILQSRITLAYCGLTLRGFDHSEQFDLNRSTCREPAARRQRSTCFHNYYS